MNPAIFTLLSWEKETENRQARPYLSPGPDVFLPQALPQAEPRKRSMVTSFFRRFVRSSEIHPQSEPCTCTQMASD